MAVLVLSDRTDQMEVPDQQGRMEARAPLVAMFRREVQDLLVPVEVQGHPIPIASPSAATACAHAMKNVMMGIYGTETGVITVVSWNIRTVETASFLRVSEKIVNPHLRIHPICAIPSPAHCMRRPILLRARKDIVV